MSFPRYPEYKDSGVEWLGEVPAHWAIPKLKHVANIRNGRDYKEVETEDDNGYPVIGSGGQFSRATGYLYSGESVLLGRKGTIDRPLYINGSFWTVDTMFYTELAAGIDGRFLFYYATTFPFGLYSTNTALPSMAQEDLANLNIAVPKVQEQRQIAAFLGHETGKIDALIEEQRRLIELLKEKRQAVISHAVTKGLDPNVPMKDSGVEWLGEVPVHWELWKVSHAFRGIGSGTTPPSNQTQWYEEGTVPWVTTSELRESSIVDTKKRITERALSEFSSLQMHPPGSLVIAMYGATIGRLGFLNVAATTNQACCVLSRPEAVEPAFAFYWFLAFKDVVIRLYASGGGQPNINQETIAALRVAAPSRQEQQSIAQFLHQNLAGIDALIEEAQSAISLFQERRSALISSAVTGKIDVRGWQAGVESDEPELAMVAEEPAGYSAQGGAA
ncbi:MULTISPECIES: restriction endonuclease subunit S [unclassified Thioalkalivibrio]|uniref:restriction endonuclease subunit S n=1 Tax=unclassified Thioalkalivibrio TaxID=2621013 RepID=UPI0003A7C250|nr:MULTISPECIES: restriction endonuclease subunit S [unclassified Thioalkalivibrio]